MQLLASTLAVFSQLSVLVLQLPQSEAVPARFTDKISTMETASVWTDASHEGNHMPNDILVSDANTLLAALADAKGGETIYLRGGDYGNLTLLHGNTGNFRFDETVRLVSADADNPAVISGLRMSNASNISFEGLTFDYEFKFGHPTHHTPFRINSSQDITITNSHFSGDNAGDGFPTARGLTIHGSDRIEISGNEIEGFHYGMAVAGVRDISILDNDVHSIRADGMNFSNVQRALIEGNQIHNFIRAIGSSDHADMIQFHQGQNTGSPSTDIVIRGNHFDSGAGYFVQTILIGNEVVRNGRAGDEMFYRNFLIEENVIINSQLHGITVGAAHGVTIRNNSVLRVENPTSGSVSNEAVMTPRISVANESTNVVITDNVTARITGHEGQQDWTVANNIYVQYRDPEAPNFYGNYFVSSSLQLDGDRHNYIVQPGSVIDLAGAGASAMRAPVVEAAFNIEAAVRNSPEVVFDAAVFADQHPPGTQYLWDFGDGATATGPLVSHVFGYAGIFDVRLTVIDPNGTISSAQMAIPVQASDHLRMNADGNLVRNEFGDLTEIDFAAAQQGGYLALGGPGISGSIGRNEIRPLLDADAFALDLSFRATNPGNVGEIFRIHGNMIASVNAWGNIAFQVWDERGEQAWLSSSGSGVRLNDGERHDVTMQLQDGKLQLWLNGEHINEVDFNGTVRSSGNHDLTFGNQWHAASRFFDGELTGFAIRTPYGAPAEPPETDEAALQDPDQMFTDPAEDSDPRIVLATHDTVETGGPGITAAVDRSDLLELFNQQEIGISFTLDAETAGNQGEVFRLHGSLWVHVSGSGELVVQGKSTEGEHVWLRSEGMRVNDGDPHYIDIQLSGGQLSLWVNGEKLAEDDFGGTFIQRGRHDLTFGNQWHNESRFFTGEVSDFTIDMADIFTAVAPLDHPDIPLI